MQLTLVCSRQQSLELVTQAAASYGTARTGSARWHGVLWAYRVLGLGSCLLRSKSFSKLDNRLRLTWIITWTSTPSASIAGPPNLVDCYSTDC